MSSINKHATQLVTARYTVCAGVKSVVMNQGPAELFQNVLVIIGGTAITHIETETSNWRIMLIKYERAL